MTKNASTSSKSSLPGKHRDAGTGRFVSKAYAEKNPLTTVKETEKRKHFKG